ncbi:MAG: hypothetical protein HKO57_07655, partial [Akkermansiaceae bacterium]|nr:hypothetical protein [Akkermansiaceae bacterium]
AAGALRLTELGSLTLAGGRDPAGRWRRAWDGQWRLLAFDIPAKTQAPRMKFWRWLRANHFGLLQKSVWIHPDPIPDVDGFAEAAGLPLSHMVLFSGELSGGMRPRAIADAAWKFDEIDAGYRAYLAFAERAGRQLRTKAPSEKLLREIVVEDRHAWQQAVRPDPLLPKALLPPDYEGRAAWKARQKLHHALWKLRPAP